MTTSSVKELSDKEVIRYAINTAVSGGFELPSYDWDITVYSDGSADIGNGESWALSLNDLIFDHRFARALWGDGRFNMGSHLRDLVWAEDRIGYLRRHLSER